MTLANTMMEQFSLIQYGDFFLRIIIACLCGAAIGFERSMRYKEAGIRTHIIVCCAASLMMIVSKYGFVDMTDSAGNGLLGTHGTDPARIAAQVVTGISFLGAGIIFRNGINIRGLTTAAGIWATSGIGLAIGAGLYIIGIFSTIVIAMIQIIMHRHSLNADMVIVGHVHCIVEDNQAFQAAMEDYMEKNQMRVLAGKVAIDDNDGSATYDLTLRMSHHMSLNDLTTFLASLGGVHEIRCELQK